MSLARGSIRAVAAPLSAKQVDLLGMLFVYWEEDEDMSARELSAMARDVMVENAWEAARGDAAYRYAWADYTSVGITITLKRLETRGLVVCTEGRWTLTDEGARVYEAATEKDTPCDIPFSVRVALPRSVTTSP